jgi:hypothetical protein
MSYRWIAIIAALTFTALGCGGQEERAAAPSPTATSTKTPTATPTSTKAPELAQARSTKQCAQLWNEDALDDSFQVTANEFVADLAPVDVYVTYEKGHCYVVAPIGGRRIATFTAAKGRRPFTVPTRRRLKSGERFSYNARADRTGRVELES